jgi:hypothetical protein
MNRVGKLIVSEDLILKWLDYADGGTIRRIGLSDWENRIEITIEHPDMPEVRDGDAIQVVNPRYITTQDALGHSVTIRERNGNC